MKIDIKHIVSITAIFALGSLFACKEDVKIDIEDGEQMVGVYGSFTNEHKRHTITITRSAEFYSLGSPQGIKGATVFIVATPLSADANTDIDTILFQPTAVSGVYETKDICNAKKGYSYEMHARFNDNGKERELTAKEDYTYEDFSIDTISIHKNVFNGNESDNIYKICPYFDARGDNNTNFLAKVSINGKLISDTLTEFNTLKLRGLYKVYFNGHEMGKMFDKDMFPVGVYYLDNEKLDERLYDMDLITLHLYKISEDYYKYINEVKNSRGSNPFFGSPSNARSNIKPSGEALGFFFVASNANFTTQVGGNENSIIMR